MTKEQLTQKGLDRDAIMPEEVEKVKSTMHVGDMIDVAVATTDTPYPGTATVEVYTVTVAKTYPHLFKASSGLYFRYDDVVRAHHERYIPKSNAESTTTANEKEAAEDSADQEDDE